MRKEFLIFDDTKCNTVLLDKIAKRIKTIREKKNITQEEFYNDTNIHIGRIETGRFNMTIITLCNICEYLNVSLEEFFSII